MERKNNLCDDTAKKSRLLNLSSRAQRGTSPMECRTRKPGGVPQSALVRSLTFVRDDRARSKRKYFTQHSQAILEKLNFATFSVIPAHRNFTDSQSGMLREIKQ